MDTIKAVQQQPQQPEKPVASGTRPMDSIEAPPKGPDDLTALGQMSLVMLDAEIQRADANGICR